MIKDKENAYSEAQALTATAVSTNTIDHRKDRDLGRGTPMAVVITVRVAPSSNDGDETYTAKLEVDDAVGFGSATQVGATATIPRTAKIGDQFVIAVPQDSTFEQHSRLTYTLGGTTPTITVDAELMPQWAVQGHAVYADNRTIA